MFITKNELNKIEKKQYLGSSISSLSSLIDKIKAIKNNELNNIVITKGDSFHNPHANIWIINSQNMDTDLISKLRSVYKSIIEEEISLFGLSRKSEHFSTIINNLCK